MRQDQKQTPNKYASRSYKKRMLDEALSKDLLCPFNDTFSLAILSNFTPMRKQPEYLLSPSPIKKDLFSQLLGTQTKQNSPADCYDDPIEEENLSISEMSSEEDNSMLEEDNSSDGEANWSQENGIKKRKRKSTAQIKLLKQELDGEMNWTKEKIVRMAQITGLSQSQVYKWCWDQKKKQNKGKQQNCRNFHQKRKLIKKPGMRLDINMVCPGRQREEESQEFQKQHNINPQTNQNPTTSTSINIKMKQNGHSLHTKRTLMKSAVVMETGQTEKKVNKRLIFN